MSIFLLSNDLPSPLNTTSCTNGNLLYIFSDRAQLGKQVYRDTCMLSLAIAIIEITCESCNLSTEKLLQNFLQKTTRDISLRKCGVLPAGIQCSECHMPCKLGLTAISGIVTARIRCGGIAVGWICHTSNFFVTTFVVPVGDPKCNDDQVEDDQQQGSPSSHQGIMSYQFILEGDTLMEIEYIA